MNIKKKWNDNNESFPFPRGGPSHSINVFSISSPLKPSKRWSVKTAPRYEGSSQVCFHGMKGKQVLVFYSSSHSFNRVPEKRAMFWKTNGPHLSNS
jgi:hypothetical protein